MAGKSKLDQLSRRERQIMDIVYRAGRASANDVLDQMHDPPSYSAVRALLRILEEKGLLRHEMSGTRYMYLPTVAPERARQSALRKVLDTFFDGSTERAVAALLELSRDGLSDQEAQRLSLLIDEARKEGR
jgi:predicted transcriptional regulator